MPTTVKYLMSNNLFVFLGKLSTEKTMKIVKIFVLTVACIIGLAQTNPVPLPQTFSQLIDILRHHTDQGNLSKHIDNKTVRR